ncbi:glycosyltransferase [Rossellomorea marisflavi]|nr:glycosyltransferase [Rossellomorea marisflavi]MDW4528322.1 glycosyltransferase [Rossellomorea marisflavi]
MKKIYLLALILLFTLLMNGQTTTHAKPQDSCISQSEVEFENSFRRLWIDHVLWTSNYITSATTADAGDQKQVLTRLLKNQEDIGNAIKPVYGEQAGNQLTGLLKEHIVIAGKIVDAAKRNDTASVNKLNKEWYKNADEIAAFLSSSNPNLKNEELKELLYMHLKLVTDDVIASVQNNWSNRITSIDEGVSHIILMSDAISSGVVKQFPDKF